MRPGCTPVDRRANVICHNAKCSLRDARTCICGISSSTCRDRHLAGDQRSEIGGRKSEARDQNSEPSPL